MGSISPSTNIGELAAQVATLLNKHNKLYYFVTPKRVLKGKVDYLVELLGDIVIGVIGLRYEYRSESIEICHLCVHPAARGQGLAKKLISRAIEIAPRERLWCHVREENVASIKAFERHGFKTQRERFKHDGSWMLTLRLSKAMTKEKQAGV